MILSIREYGTGIRNDRCPLSLIRQLLTNENVVDHTHLPGARLTPENVLIELS